MQQKAKRGKSNILIKLAIGAIGVLVAFCALGFILNAVDPRPPEQSAAASVTAPAESITAPSAEPAPTLQPSPTPLATVGQSILIGNYEWKILEVKNLGPTFSLLEDRYTLPEAAGTYLLLRFEHKTLSGSRPKANVVNEIVLVDEQGQEYKPIVDIAFIRQSVEENRCYLEFLQEGETRTCDAFYDVAADAQGLRAELRGFELFGEPTLIDLGL